MSEANSSTSTPDVAVSIENGATPSGLVAVRNSSSSGVQRPVLNSISNLPKAAEVNVEESPIAQNPSQDIRGDLIKALNECKETTAAPFYSSRSYSAVQEPNPWIKIDGFGVLSLPLSVPEAKRLVKSNLSQQTPKRKRGEKTKSGMWEVEASKIHFENPAWNKWLNDVVLPHVCENLGINIELTAPRAELCGLLVCETGSQYDPHADSAQSPNMFATMSIILPSQFSGGSIQLNHGKIRTIDVAANSLMMIHALAWHVGVSHSMHRLVSGHRLVLSYNLFHTKNFIPTLPLVSDGSARLRHVLLSWKQAKDGKIQVGKRVDKLCYVLEHYYSNHGKSELDLCIGALKGRDAGLVELLAPLAAELNFGVFIGNVTLGKRGEAYNPGGSRWGYKDDNADNVVFRAIEDKMLEFTSAIDLDGMPMRYAGNNGFSHIDMDDIIPQAFGEEGSVPDRKKYEEYEGRKTLTHYFDRSVLVFCLDERLFEIGNITKYACEILTKCLSPNPSPKEKKLANDLIERCQSGSGTGEDLKRSLNVLLDAALRWRDNNVYARALSACPPALRLQCVGIHGFIKAYKASGLKLLESHLDAALQGDQSNSRRFSLVHELMRLGNEQKDEALREWCSSRLESVLRSLRQATEHDIDSLVGIIKQRGAQVLRDIILPQLPIAIHGVPFWSVFLQRLAREKSGIPPNPNETEAIISAQVTAIMSAASPFPMKLVAATGYEKERLEPNIHVWIRYIKLCILLNRSDLCSSYLRRMLDEYNKATAQLKDLVVVHFIPAAITGLGAEIATYDPDTSGLFREFFRFALGLYVDSRIIQGRGNLNVPTLMAAVKYSCDVEYVSAKLGPAYGLLAQRMPTQAREILSSFVSETQKTVSDPLAQNCEVLINDLMKSIIASTDFGYSKWRPMEAESAELNLIKFCRSTGLQSYISLILAKILLPKADSNQQTQIQNGIIHLIRLLPQLKLYLTSLNQTFTHEPFASFLAKAIKCFVNEVLGPKPTNVVSSALVDTVGCGAAKCWICLSFRKFLLAEDRVLSVSRHADIRRHLEALLEKIRTWGITWTTIRSGSPHTLQITKPDVMIPPSFSAWMNKRAAGRKFVESIGDEAVLVQILGADFLMIANVLGMRQTLQEAPQVPQTQARASNTPGPSEGPMNQQQGTSTTKKRHSTSESQEPKRARLDSDVADPSGSPEDKQ